VRENKNEKAASECSALGEKNEKKMKNEKSGKLFLPQHDFPDRV
jgi:hypothetical protein